MFHDDYGMVLNSYATCCVVSSAALLRDVTQCSPPKKRLLTSGCSHFRFIYKNIFAPNLLFETCPIRQSLLPVAGDVTNKHDDTGLQTQISGFGHAIAKEMLVRSLQFEKLMLRKKIYFITCLIKKPGNQVASLDVLAASSECCFFPPDFNLEEAFSPKSGLKDVLNFFLYHSFFH